jgi:hypothetical protein
MRAGWRRRNAVPPVAGLAGRRERRAAGPHAQPRVTAATRVRCWDGGRAGSRSGSCHDVRGAMTAHSTHHQAVVLAAAGA